MSETEFLVGFSIYRTIVVFLPILKAFQTQISSNSVQHQGLDRCSGTGKKIQRKIHHGTAEWAHLIGTYSALIIRDGFYNTVV